MPTEKNHKSGHRVKKYLNPYQIMAIFVKHGMLYYAYKR